MGTEKINFYIKKAYISSTKILLLIWEKKYPFFMFCKHTYVFSSEPQYIALTSKILLSKLKFLHFKMLLAKMCCQILTRILIFNLKIFIADYLHSDY